VLNPDGDEALELSDDSSSSDSEEDVSRSDSVIPANMSLLLLSFLTSILVLNLVGFSFLLFSSLLLRKESEDIKFNDISIVHNSEFSMEY